MEAPYTSAMRVLRQSAERLANATKLRELAEENEAALSFEANNAGSDALTQWAERVLNDLPRLVTSADGNIEILNRLLVGYQFPPELYAALQLSVGKLNLGVFKDVIESHLFIDHPNKEHLHSDTYVIGMYWQGESQIQLVARERRG